MEKIYKKVPLINKLGIKSGMTIFIVNKPDNFDQILGIKPDNVKEVLRLQKDLDYIHYFTKSQESLVEVFPNLKQYLSKTGFLWISWPKGSSNIRTDLNENIIRKIGLDNRLVDVKICSIDETWSALKFIYRKKDR